MTLQTTSKNYKQTMNHFIREENNKNRDKLRKMNDKEPKKYWRFLNNIKHKSTKTSQPLLEEFYDYFKNINENNIDDTRLETLTNGNSNEYLSYNNRRN